MCPATNPRKRGFGCAPGQAYINHPLSYVRQESRQRTGVQLRVARAELAGVRCQVNHVEANNRQLQNQFDQLQAQYGHLQLRFRALEEW